MSLMIEATYENGVLRPAAQIPWLAEGQRVTITIEDDAEIQKRETEFRRKMQEDGLLVRFPKPDEPPPANFKPIENAGKPLSETIIEERR
ncbi:MAG: antitoxin family protein [Planctomycetes bacterium]|nr:antitoxin family protein [Planctomycetota bacterium]